MTAMTIGLQAPVGVGPPEGVVTAPVGSIYTDTAATNGALRWIKWSGAGAIGWRVLYGDTGFRDIAEYMINGWTCANLRIRRIGHTVWLHVQALNQANATDNVVIAPDDSVWAGWRLVPPIGGAGVQIPLANVGGIFVRFQPWQSGTAGLRVIREDNTTGVNTYTGQVFWQTPDIWPSSLP